MKKKAFVGGAVLVVVAHVATEWFVRALNEALEAAFNYPGSGA